MITHYDTLGWSLWLPHGEVVSGSWCVLNLAAQQSVSGGGHLSQPMIWTRLSQHGLCVWLKSRLSGSNFFTSSQSFSNQVSSCYLEEAFKWKPTSQSTSANLLFLFLFHIRYSSRSSAQSSVFLSVYHENLAFSVLALTLTFKGFRVRYKTIHLLLVKLLSNNLMQHCMGYLLISC